MSQFYCREDELRKLNNYKEYKKKEKAFCGGLV